MDFQWYPGHMTKAKRMMQENMKLIDIMIELVDARIPLSSRNPDIDQLAANKSRLILLNKTDMADERVTAQWEEYFKEKGFYVARTNARSGKGVKGTQAIVMDACKEKLERDRKRGIKNRPIRAMIAGIPNVGKSTFINSLVGKACTKTGNKPGVTKGKQWIKLNKNIELLDTPGILWPKFEDQQVGLRLALIGSIRDEILNQDEMAIEQAIVMDACKEKLERDRKRGIKNRPIRAMIAGIPNVGKSTFINSLVGKACTKTGNKPGVTKGKQWIKLNKNIELLDTPGILWPKFEDQQVGLRLALIGSIRDEILNQDEMAIELIEYLKNHYKGILADRYQVDESEDKVKILEQVAMNRNCKMKGNELDYEKASKILLEEFRNGKLGKISLEVPEEIKEA